MAVVIKLARIYDIKSKIYEKLLPLVDPVDRALKQDPAYTWELLGKYLETRHFWNILPETGFFPLIDLLIEVNHELHSYDDGKEMVFVEPALAALASPRINDAYLAVESAIDKE